MNKLCYMLALFFYLHGSLMGNWVPFTSIKKEPIDMAHGKDVKQRLYLSGLALLPLSLAINDNDILSGSCAALGFAIIGFTYAYITEQNAHEIVCSKLDRLKQIIVGEMKKEVVIEPSRGMIGQIIHFFQERKA